MLGNLNSGPHVFAANTLPTEQSPQPQTTSANLFSYSLDTARSKLIDFFEPQFLFLKRSISVSSILLSSGS